MGLDTDLDVSPYFDDFDEDKDFYGVLFKPSVSVQVRELNQLQSILRKQFERFGSAIYDNGTIVSGCNFAFYPAYPYAKIRDVTTTGALAVPSQYEGLFVKNSANLQALVVDSAQGLEATTPDLNTLYLSYRNSGSNQNTFAFSPGDVLTVFDANSSVFSVSIQAAGLGFSNTNIVVFTPALVVNVTTGSFSNGGYVTQPSTGANLQIISVDVTSLASQGRVILGLAPRAADLSNVAGSAAAWQVANNDSIMNSGNTAVGTVLGVYGTGAAATILTDGSGRVVEVSMSSPGAGYQVAPTVSVWSPGNPSGVAAIGLTALNYLTMLPVSNSAGSVGNGYAFGVGGGVIFQKGLFLQVDPQVVVVDKYDQVPNAVSVGFQSGEFLVNSQVDSTLLDNSQGTQNALAPGADRLKLVPTLVVAGADVSNSSYLALVRWSEGNPYQQQQATDYSRLGDAMAQRTFEEAGNFVIDPWQVTTRSPFASATEGNTMSIVVDPGEGYIQGYRVQTISNYVVDVAKSTKVHTSNTNAVISLNYGLWLPVQELGGLFQFNTGDLVSLRDASRTYLTTLATTGVSNTTAPGNQIGTARVRSLVPSGGVQGSNVASYKMYLFNITMAQGKNFANVKSVAYTTGAFPGVADVVPTFSPTINANVCALGNVTFDSLLFPAGVTSLQSMANTIYQYRTIDQTVTMANSGNLSKTLSSSGETYPNLGAQPAASLQQTLLIPLSNNLVAAANYAGNVTASTATANIVGTGTTFVGQVQAGDWVQVFANSTLSEIVQITQVVNNTLIVAAANLTFSQAGVALFRCFPQDVPIPLGTRSGLSGNVSANGAVLTINLGNSFSFSSNVVCALGVNVLRSNVAPGTKQAARDNYVLIDTANNVAGTTGPWCLGVSDVFRLKGVYLGTNSSVNATAREVTSDFFVNTGQTEDYVDVAYLAVHPGTASAAAIANGVWTWVLARFDAFTVATPGYYDSASYLGTNTQVVQTNDSTPLVNLGSSVSSWEVPEVFTSTGTYYDLLNTLDFRPIAANTATPGTTPGTAPVNPVYSLGFGNTANPANDKKFPVPDGSLSALISQYGTRIDSVFVGGDGHVFVVRGKSSPDPTKAKTPNAPGGAMKLADVTQPSYPSMPQNPSSIVAEVSTTLAGSGGLTASIRRGTHTVSTAMGYQPAGYNMAQIGALDRRIANLEYISALSALETDVSNRVIPSSVNPTLNRFKYGFFVDPFTTALSQATLDPGYAANVCGGLLTPPVVCWTQGFAPTLMPTPQYVDFPIIRQDQATTPPVVANTPPPPPPPAANTPPANTWLLRVDHDLTGTTNVASLIFNTTDTQTVTASATAGNAAFFFAIPPTVSLNADQFDPVAITIYQGNTVLFTIANNSVALTNTDAAYVTSNAVPAGWFQGVTLGPLVIAGGGFVSGAGKITWTHNPAGGLTYTVVAVRQTTWDHFTYAMNYPIDVVTQAPLVSPTTGLVTYTGLMIVDPGTMLLQETGVSLVYGGEQDIEGGESWIIVGSTFSSFLPPASGVSLSAINSLDISEQTDGTIGGIIFGSQGVAAQGLQRVGGAVPFDSTSFNVWNGVALGPPQPTAIVDESFRISAYGLLPGTKHSFTVQGINKSGDVRPLGGNLGDPLITTAAGTITFDFFFSPSTVDQDVAHQFLSATTGLTADAVTQAASAAAASILGGKIVLQLSAPNSTAVYSLPVAIDPLLSMGIPVIPPLS